MKKDKLHTIKSTGFKTPNNYFESFEDKLLDRLSGEGSICNIKSPGFEVPSDYFDTLEDKILYEIDNKETPVVKLKNRTSFYYIAGIAVSLLLLVAIIFNQGNINEELSVEMVERYFDESDLDSYELAQLLSDADLLEDDFIITETNFNEDNIESYLLDNADIEAILQ